MSTNPLTYSVLASCETENELDNVVLGNLHRAAVDAHPATAQILGFFQYGHLQDELRAVSRAFAVTAVQTADRLAGTTHGAELTTALRKLLEAKDCAVRAAIGVAR